MLKIIFEEGSTFLVSRGISARGISVETSKTTRRTGSNDVRIRLQISCVGELLV